MKTSKRSIAIDAYRAIVMLLMIFVNDTWTLVSIPKWIDHLPADVDGLGLADVVFPAFLFIVGLSIPFAIRSRLKKGESKLRIAMHIALRALALIIMGVFHVNLGHYPQDAHIPKAIWQILITIGFFLVWMNYSNQKTLYARILKVSGTVLLFLMALFYKDVSDPWGTIAMQSYWWGILGMIGWGYLLVSLFFLLSGGGMWLQVLAFGLWVLFNAFAQSTWADPLAPIRDYVWIIGDGSVPALTACGVIISLLYSKMHGEYLRFMGWGVGISVALLLVGLLAREEWIISKIWATPSFTLVCAAISVAGFVVMYFITDVMSRTSWYRWISPAGTSSLTCYLLPYIHHALLAFVVWRLPEFLRTGGLGIAKSILYALLIIAITGWLEKRRLNLKL